jgi:hypothetical protein
MTVANDSFADEAGVDASEAFLWGDRLCSAAEFETKCCWEPGGCFITLVGELRGDEMCEAAAWLAECDGEDTRRS